MLKNAPPETYELVFAANDPEARMLAYQFRAALTNAGWTNAGTLEIPDPQAKFGIFAPAPSRGLAVLTNWAIKSGCRQNSRRLVVRADRLSPATLISVQETLEAIPGGDQPGRLTRPLKPLGFEALSGVTIAPQLRIVDKPARKEPESKLGREAPEAGSKEGRAHERELARQRDMEERERKERQREAERTLKAAEAAMLRAEEEVKKAEKALGEARAMRDAAVSEYQRARLRAHE